MAEASLDANGAVVVPANSATPPISSDSAFSHVARPAGFGGTTASTSSTAVPAGGETGLAATQPVPAPEASNTAAVAPDVTAESATVANPAEADAAIANNAAAAAASTTAAPPAMPPAAETTPSAEIPPVANPAPTSASVPPPSEPAVLAADQTVIDQFSAASNPALEPTAVAGADQASAGLPEVNVFAPEGEGDPAAEGATSIDPAYTVAQTISSPAAATTQPVSVSVTQSAPTNSQTTSVASSTSSPSSNTVSGTASSTAASTSAEEEEEVVTETASVSERENTSSSTDSLASISQVTEVTTASATDAMTTIEEPTDQAAETTFVSGSTTYTGTAALAAAAAASSESGNKQEKDKDGLSSFAIIGIVGGILVSLILLYIAWFQWRKRRARDDLERIDDIDDYSPTGDIYDPFDLAKEKHSGLDFFDEPLSSRRSQKSRIKSNAPSVMPHNPFADTAIIANPDPSPMSSKTDADYQRRLETQYTESMYTDPGDAGLGTAKTQGWYAEGEVIDEEHNDHDRRPSYIDGPQSIYHETNDPDNPNAHPWTEVPLSARSPQSAKETAPPVPPLPAVYQKRTTRPETDFSYGNFYGGYDDPESRPTTQMTPSTSALLPWLNKETDAPPPIPVSEPVDPKTLPVHQPKKKFTGFGSPPKMPLRTPPAAAIAQKPITPNKGWLGAIPAFR